MSSGLPGEGVGGAIWTTEEEEGGGSVDIVLGGAMGGIATVAHAPGIFPAASGSAGTGTRFDFPSPQDRWLDMNSALFV